MLAGGSCGFGLQSCGAAQRDGVVASLPLSAFVQSGLRRSGRRCLTATVNLGREVAQRPAISGRW